MLMGNHYGLYRNKIKTEGNCIPSSVGSLSRTSFYIPDHTFAPFLTQISTKVWHNDTSMNSPGFGLSFDMKIISEHIFCQKFIFFQAVFQESKKRFEEKYYTTLLRSVSAFESGVACLQRIKTVGVMRRSISSAHNYAVRYTISL